MRKQKRLSFSARSNACAEGAFVNPHSAYYMYFVKNIIVKGFSSMKSLGIIRKIDGLGRLVLPVEIRRSLSLNLHDPMEFYMDGENIVIRKYNPSCVFCGGVEHTVKFGERLICPECLNSIIGTYSQH